MQYSLDLLDNQVVLFADILGFTNLIKNNKGVKPDSQEGLTFLLGSYYGIVTERFKNTNPEKIKVRFNWTSDSIFMSCHISDINCLFEKLITLQREFLSAGLYLRGGISVGENYHNENFWGPATIEAVNLEKSIAIYPRIVIKENDLKLLRLKEPYISAFEVDFDGVVYLNLLKLMLARKKVCYQFLEIYIRNVLKDLREAPNPKISQKYGWLKQNLINTFEENSNLVKSIIDAFDRKKLEYKDIKDVNGFLNLLKEN